MKNKILNIFIIIVLILGIATGCGSKKESSIINDDTENNSINNEQKVDIIGEWKATKTNNDDYSLSYVYGTSITTSNSLVFNEDGTYKLYLGSSYSQSGEYTIDGSNIKIQAKTFDTSDNKIIDNLLIENNQIILKETTDNDTQVDIIFENINNISQDISIQQNSENVNNNSNESNNNLDYIKVGNSNVKYGTYRGQAGATGELLVLYKSGYASWNGKTYKFYIEKYNFGQDSSSTSLEDAIVLKDNSNNIVYALYVENDGTLNNDPDKYIFEK